MLKRMRLISCLAFAAGCMFWMTGSAQAQWIPRPAEPPAEAEVQPGEPGSVGPLWPTGNTDVSSQQPNGSTDGGTLPPDGPQPSGQLDAEFPAEPPATQPETGLIPLAGRTRSTCAQEAPAPDVSAGVALQIALDRAGFSPGLIDGNIGRKTQVALAAFQAYAGLPASGKADDATRRALGVGAPPLVQQYTLTDADIALVGPWPKDWEEKSKAKRLGYKSVAAMAAERGHCSLVMLAALNHGVKLDCLNAGDSVWLPYIGPTGETPKAACLEIDLGQKVLRVLDKSGKAVALFHCSIAKSKEKLPKRSCKVAVVAPNPVYIFDPKMWPEVKNVHRKLVIPPGPRNPVGLCWIGLSLDGYGIHGTPEPEMIGKTGSHGCFRLTNWDAQRLGRMVHAGMDVRFKNGPAAVAMRR